MAGLGHYQKRNMIFGEIEHCTITYLYMFGNNAYVTGTTKHAFLARVSPCFVFAARFTLLGSKENVRSTWAEASGYETRAMVPLRTTSREVRHGGPMCKWSKRGQSSGCFRVPRPLEQGW